MKPVTRRQLLSMLAASPFAARSIRAFAAQTRPGPKHRVFLGGGHGLLLAPEGTLMSWNMNEHGDGLAPASLGLGHNRPTPPYTLEPVAGLTNVVTAAAGTNCSFAVLADGRLMAWGLNANGMLGTTSPSQFETRLSWGPDSNVPTPVVTKFDAVGVSSTGVHVLALTRDGNVYSWGDGRTGALGIGKLPVINPNHSPDPTFYLPYPVRIPDLANVVAISAGSAHSLALLKDGTVRAWGSNRYGQLGDGTTVDRDKPVTVQGLQNAIVIDAGGDHSLALLADGTVMTWGSKDSAGTPGPIPTLVGGLRNIKAIAAGPDFGIAITETGDVISWGDSTVYQTGRGRKASSAPAPVKGITGAQSIEVRGSTTIAVLDSGRMMTWGFVRPWTRPDDGEAILSPYPILFWLDGLDQP